MGEEAAAMQKNAVLQFRSLFFFCCSMQVSSTATAAAASDNLGKLQISTHDRRIAFFFNPLLYCSSARCIFTGIWHICQKVKGFLTTSAHFLPYLFLAENSRIQMRSFCLEIKNLSKLHDSWQRQFPRAKPLPLCMHTTYLPNFVIGWVCLPFMVSSEFPMKEPLLLKIHKYHKS